MWTREKSGDGRGVWGCVRFFFLFSPEIRWTWTGTQWTCPPPVGPAFRCGKKNFLARGYFRSPAVEVFFFRIYFVFFFSARGDPLSTAQKYVCLVVLSGSVHVQLYLPSVAEKKILRTRIFSVASEKFGCSVAIDSVSAYNF